ncbi:MAG TPA: EF-P beta-lysylation protein EpmB [Gammaproteobacteria bacterium]|nr:EF-P beta-lysylation protein EpmB [Gammaproteobacteria bacterium]
MIPATLLSGQPVRWQVELAQAISDPAELIAVLGLDEALLPAARRAAERFPLRVPRSFVARMRRGDPADPLLRQVLPLDLELTPVPGYRRDPVGDLDARLAPGVLQKYRGRVLVVTTGACAVHCRYCFRRHFPYADENPRPGQWHAALEAVRADPTIHEVILSGGDPLALSDARLAEFTDALATIPHVWRLRVHTRTPVVLPARVDEGLIRWLDGVRLQKVFVLHVNHPREIDMEVCAAAGRLAAAGATLLNQSVLLRGVNDEADTLVALSETLFAAGILPYYLHLLDRVEGAAHFDVPENRALGIMAQLHARLPGYLVPRLVREVPGAPGKLPLFPELFHA